MEVAEAIYTAPNGRIRVSYRTVVNAEDELQRALVVGRYMSEQGSESDRAYVRLKVISEFVLATFCTKLELLDEGGAVTETHDFTMGLLKTLTGVYAEDAWPADLALKLYREIIDKTAVEVEDVKKTSETVLPPLNSDKNQPATPPESSRT